MKKRLDTLQVVDIFLLKLNFWDLLEMKNIHAENFPITLIVKISYLQSILTKIDFHAKEFVQNWNGFFLWKNIKK